MYLFIYSFYQIISTYMYLGNVVLDTKVSVIYHFNSFLLDTDLRQLSLSLALIPPSLFSIARLRDISDDNVCMSPKVEESGCVCHAREMLWSHV